MQLSRIALPWIILPLYVVCHTSSVPPRISPFKVVEDLSEGQRLSLVCLVSRGTPPISFSWMKDGNQLNSVTGIKVSLVDEDQGQLKIDRLSVDHAGNYTCSAKNAFGADQMSVTVALKFKPRWLNDDNDVINSVPGVQLSIDCRAAGHPQPTIKLIKGSDEINGTEHENGFFTIASVSVLNTGEYRCEASNSLGKIHRRITLSLSGTIFIPPFLCIFISGINTSERRNADVFA
ncbi:Down syndrome cell adhesion molecule-like protein Dscam2 [Varroa jacobsoni]|uniref:Down syndrome cell adhesion molecule-like protein Dscam2 n=1 Tax=Varroa jacobsoni TaxID=62625 RepID=UPI000BF47BC3|nr:Down syndrome cell adhesion molecule-like protein Dscam2 [Varroa jacobsoni]